MEDWQIYAAILAGMIIVALWLVAVIKPKLRGWKRFIAAPIILCGIYLSTLTQTTWDVPFFGEIALGSVAGASVGALLMGVTWAIIGTLGVATGGLGFALGPLSLIVIGALLGGIGGGAAEMLGITTKPYVHPVVWISIVLAGFCLWFWLKPKKPPHDTGADSAR